MSDPTVNQLSGNKSDPRQVSSQVVNQVWDKFQEKLSTGDDIASQVGAVRDPEKIAAAAAEEESARSVFGRRNSDVPGDTVGRRDGDFSLAAEVKDLTIRVDAAKLDEVLTLSGEIGLTKNRLNHIRTEILQGRINGDTFKALDLIATQLNLLVMNLQNAVMKTRMQPVGILFKKYPRVIDELAKALKKKVEFTLIGESTELDKTMMEDLNDPIVHLIRNAVDHGLESPKERTDAGKSEKGLVQLEARQEGDHALITITDDGRGMRPDALRRRAIEKGLVSAEVAGKLDDEQCLDLIFLPGFSTKDKVSGISGRGVGMDVVKSKIQKLNGSIDIHTESGIGTRFTISLPLTLAILPVLILRLGEQSFAVPLAMVREIISITPDQLQNISGRSTMVVRGEVLPVLSLSNLIGWESSTQPDVGVLMQFGSNNFILSADGFAGHDDVVIKPLDTFRPKGVAGVTMSSEGDIVLILDIKELLEDLRSTPR
jgi:two-component system chemotaxis sensor kinase CheA